MKPEKDNITEVYEDRYKHDCFAAVSYYINQKKKIIVCKIEPSAAFPWVSETLSYGESIKKDYFMVCSEHNISYIGKATCMDCDEFDIEFGKKLAYDKAMFKMLNDQKKFIENDIATLKASIDEDTKVIEDLNKQYDKVSERFERKMKEIAK